MTTNFILKLLLILLCFGRISSYYEGGISNLKFVKNKYEYMVVFINDNVQETPTFIDQLKATFTAASRYLYNATRKRAYFGKIFVRIPNSWQKKNGYSDAPALITKPKADILISPPRPSLRNFPFTRSYAGCGHPGIHIQLNTDFILKPGTFGSVCANPPICGKPGRYLVHEFATYRYGVFNEFPFPGEEAYYFSPLTGKLERVRCSLGQYGRLYQRVNGQITTCTVDPDTGTYTDACQYVAYPLHNQGSSSLMEYQWRQETVNFCDDTVTDMQTGKFGHNREPHTQQNRLCAHRSTWDVISNSQDFVGNINPPTSAYADPGILVFRATSRKRIAFIMNVGVEYTNKVSHAVTNIVRGLDENTDIIVHSMSLGTNSSNDRHVRSTRSEQLKNYLVSGGEMKPQRKRIRNFLKDFAKNRPNDTSLHTVLLLCGEDIILSRPDIQAFVDHDLVPHVISCKGVERGVENTILDNGGLFHEVDPQRKIVSLHHAMDTLHYVLGEGNTTPTQIVNELLEIKQRSSMISLFIWDEYLLGDLILSATYDDVAPVVILLTPGGRQISEKDVEYTHEADTKTIAIYVTKTKAMNGKWLIKVMNKQETSSEVHILVKSTNVTDTSQYPIAIKSWTKQFDRNGEVPRIGIYTDVLHGHHPLSGMTVTAHVSNGDGNDHVIHLLDNGAGADIEKDDGTYARYFPYIHQSPGPYYVHVRVSGGNGVIIKKELFTPINFESHDLGGVPDFQYNITKIPLKFGVNRTVAGGTIRIPIHIHRRHFRATFLNNQNSYLPARVHDLKIIGVSQADKTFVLSWTAPGALLDHGKASFYKLIYHNDTNLLLDYPEDATEFPNHNILSGNKSDPSEAGSPEIFKFKMTKEHSAIGFRICALGIHSSACEFSNMVTLGFQIEKARDDKVIVNMRSVASDLCTLSIATAACFVSICIVIFIKYISRNTVERTRRPKV